MANEATQQQETNLPVTAEATPAQDVTSDTKSASVQATPTETKSETWEYNGDRNAVPKEFQNYVKGLDRYVTKKDQSLAEARRKAEEYDKLVNSEEYKLLQQSRTQNTSTAAQPQSQGPIVTQDELDAIMLGDVNALQSVIDRRTQAAIEAKAREFEAQLQPLHQLTAKQREIETAEMVQSFAQLHPDFNELVESYGDYMESAVRQGMSLEQAYASTKELENKAYAKFEAKHKKLIEEKKNGSVVSTTVTGTPDVVYADNEDQAKRLAIELTLKGDPRQVHIKPKR